MPRALCLEVKQVVAELIKYFQLECENGGPLLNVNCVLQRVSAALKFCPRTIANISKEMRLPNGLSEPKKSSGRKQIVTSVSDAQKAAICCTVYEMYKNRQHITLSSLLIELKKSYNFSGGRTSLYTVMKTIGFEWKKDDPRRGLMETPRIASLRVQFLKQFVMYMDKNVWDFVYLDETWIFENGTVCKSWQDDHVKSVRKTKMDGKRYIIVHAGNSEGFIDNASLIFSSKTNNIDYHGDMNADNFLRWFENQLLKQLERPSMIIMDNARYHSTIVKTIPTTASKKEHIQSWLTLNNINFEPTMLKTELLHLVHLHKPCKEYVADNLAHQYGHRVLRLPPYHCIFNPIEMIWGHAKTYYNRHMGRDGYGEENALNMWKEALSTITKENWRHSIIHTKKIISDWWDREHVLDVEIEPIIIDVNDESSDSD